MRIEEAIKEAYEVDGDMSPCLSRESMMVFVALAEDYQKVGEGVLPDKMKKKGATDESEDGQHSWRWTNGFNACRKEVKLRLIKTRMSVVDIEKIIYIELCEHWQGMSKHKTTEVVAKVIIKEQDRRLGI